MSNPSSLFAIDFHVHTSFSHDSPMPPRLVIEMARRRGLAGIAVTDHDTIEGALAVLDCNRHSDFLVIPGIEVKSDLGDIIGLYVERQIRSRRFADVIQEIHEAGGVVYVPHPIRTFGAERIPRIHAEHPAIDLWEKFNGRYGPADFVQSRKLFDSLGISASLCGSDAHFPWDIGVFRTLLTGAPRDPRLLLELCRSASLEASPRSSLAVNAGITLGAVTKSFKKGDYAKAGRVLAALPWKAVKKSVRMAAGRGKSGS